MTAKKQKSESSTSTPSDPSKRVFDIAKPGTLPSASATARPVIITNRVMVQDPMVTATGSTPELPGTDTNDSKILPSKSRPSLDVPITDDTQTAADASIENAGIAEPAEAEAAPILPPASDKTDNTDKKAETVPPKKADSDTKKDEPAEATPATTVVSSDAASADKAEAESSEGSKSDATPSESDLAKETAKQEAEAKAQEELDKLVDDKTYFLPITSLAQRRSRNVAIFGFLLIVVLLAAWVNVALDAGLLTIPGVHSLTHFFHN